MAASSGISGRSLAGRHGASQEYSVSVGLAPVVEVVDGPGTAAAPAPVSLDCAVRRGADVDARGALEGGGVAELVGVAGVVETAVVGVGVAELGVAVGSGAGSADGVVDGLGSPSVGSGDAGGAAVPSWASAPPTAAADRIATLAATIATRRPVELRSAVV